MRTRLLIGCLALIGTAGGSVSAQNGQRPAPVISALSAETASQTVILGWADSPTAQGPVFIFRSPEPFTGTIPPDIQPVAVDYGAQTYTDEPAENGTFHYFIAASDYLGRRYDVVVPGGNTITVIVAAEEEEAVSAEEPAGSEGGISGLSAHAQGAGIIITYRAAGEARNAVLYRSLLPVTRPEDLLNAVMVQSGIDSPFVDYPMPGLSWYYALIAEDDITGGKVRIYPGRNATEQAAAVAGGTEERTVPVPSMSRYNVAPERDPFPDIQPVPLSAETTAALSGVPAERGASPPEKKPRVFTRDLEVPSGGADSALRRIVQGPFTKREWADANEQLRRFLSLPRAANTEGRARFYLGQTYYFTGRFREALLEFLFVRSLHPNEANVWIDATLAAMVR